MSADIGDRPFVVDEITATCNGCQSERKFTINPPLRSAAEFIAWTKDPKNMSPCACGARTVDLKLRLADQN